jgi:hypothetical protein
LKKGIPEEQKLNFQITPYNCLRPAATEAKMQLPNSINPKFLYKLCREKKKLRLDLVGVRLAPAVVQRKGDAQKSQ